MIKSGTTSLLCRRTSAAIVGEYRRASSAANGPGPVHMSYTLHETVADAGHKPPIVIMHGLFGCKTNWSGLSKALHNMTLRKVRHSLLARPRRGGYAGVFI